MNEMPTKTMNINKHKLVTSNWDPDHIVRITYDILRIQALLIVRSRIRQDPVV